MPDHAPRPVFLSSQKALAAMFFNGFQSSDTRCRGTVFVKSPLLKMAASSGFPVLAENTHRQFSQ